LWRQTQVDPDLHRDALPICADVNNLLRQFLKDLMNAFQYLGIAANKDDQRLSLGGGDTN